MNLYKKNAFSLTELLIVLVIIAVLFAALAPIITKRRSGASFSNESVWNYVTNDDMMDAFYDPGVPGWTSSAYVGLNPIDVSRAEVTKGAKLVIRASNSPNPQRQIQFRYGTGDGVNVGTLHADNKKNLLLGSSFMSMLPNSSYGSASNTAAGIGVLNTLLSANNTVAYGAYALATNKNLNSKNHVIAVGSNAARSLHPDAISNIFIGSNSGTSSTPLEGNVFLGAYSGATDNTIGKYNVFTGAQTGGGFSDRYASYNVVLGSKFYAKSAKNNTIIGYDTYSSGHPDIQNITAVGYDSCSSFTVTGKSGTRTCVGYTSGAGVGNTPTVFNGDSVDRVFLGGYPLGGFAGRSVLEVHNVNDVFNRPYKGNTSGGPVEQISSPTVVLNSNLAVRGNLYAPNDWESLSGYNFASVKQNLRGGNVCKSDKWRPIRRKYTCQWFRKNMKPDAFSQCLLDTHTNGGNRECTGDSFSYSFKSFCPQLNVSSDLRLKESLNINNAGLAEVLLLKPYIYTFKDDESKTPHVGVIAQDLQKIFPTAVTKAQDGYLHIRWDEMFYAAINAIKNLDNKIERLASDIVELEKNTIEISKSHSNIRKRIVLLNSRTTKLERK